MPPLPQIERWGLDSRRLDLPFELIHWLRSHKIDHEVQLGQAFAVDEYVRSHIVQHGFSANNRQIFGLNDSMSYSLPDVAQHCTALRFMFYLK